MIEIRSNSGTVERSLRELVEREGEQLAVMGYLPGLGVDAHVKLTQEPGRDEAVVTYFAADYPLLVLTASSFEGMPWEIKSIKEPESLSFCTSCCGPEGCTI